MVLLSKPPVSSLHILQYLLLFVRFFKITPTTIHNIESECAVRGEKKGRSLNFNWKRALSHWFVAYSIERYISVPLASYQRASFDCLVVPNSFNTFLRIYSQKSFNCLSRNLKNTSSQVRLSDLLFILIQFFLIFSDGVLEIGSTLFLKYVTFPTKIEISVTKHNSWQINVGHSDDVLSTVLVYFNFERTRNFCMSWVETDIHQYVNCSADFKFICFHKECWNRRVVRNLFHVKRNATNCALTGLP